MTKQSTHSKHTTKKLCCYVSSCTCTESKKQQAWAGVGTRVGDHPDHATTLCSCLEVRTAMKPDGTTRCFCHAGIRCVLELNGRRPRFEVLSTLIRVRAKRDHTIASHVCGHWDTAADRSQAYSSGEDNVSIYMYVHHLCGTNPSTHNGVLGPSWPSHLFLFLLAVSQPKPGCWLVACHAERQNRLHSHEWTWQHIADHTSSQRPREDSPTGGQTLSWAEAM